MKTSEISRAATRKIIQGDWIWHPDRGFDDKKSIWHNYRGQSRSILAFGDGHAQAFKFPTTPPAIWTSLDAYWLVKPDPAFLWW